MNEGKVPYCKPVISAEEQLIKLKERGLIIKDEEKALRYLINIGYYRLSAYCHVFEKDPVTHEFRQNVDYQDVIDLYVFDRRLRSIVMEAIDRLEVAIRARWVYAITEEYQDPFVHLDSSSFYEDLPIGITYAKQRQKLKSELQQRYCKEPAIRHFYSKYTEEMPPLWTVVHYFTLGQLCAWIHLTKSPKVKKYLAKEFGFKDYDKFKSFLNALNEIRNICAHHNRLWNKGLSKKHTRIIRPTDERFARFFPLNSNGRIYSLLILIAIALRKINPHTTWDYRLGSLINSREEWQQMQMGFVQPVSEMPELFESGSEFDSKDLESPLSCDASNVATLSLVDDIGNSNRFCDND